MQQCKSKHFTHTASIYLSWLQAKTSKKQQIGNRQNCIDGASRRSFALNSSRIAVRQPHHASRLWFVYLTEESSQCSSHTKKNLVCLMRKDSGPDYLQNLITLIRFISKPGVKISRKKKHMYFLQIIFQFRTLIK